MATDAFLASGVLSAQINRLAANGSFLTALGDVVVLPGERITTYERRRDNKEIAEKDVACFTRPAKSIYKGTDSNSFVLCPNIDPETLSLIGVYDRVISGTDTVGVKELAEDASCVCEPTVTGAGVSMLIWSCLEDCQGDPAVNGVGARLYEMTIFPRLHSFSFESTTINRYEDDPTGLTVAAIGTSNPNFGQGPGNIYPEVGGLDRTWTKFHTTVEPPASCIDCSSAVAGFASAAEYGALA